MDSLFICILYFNQPRITWECLQSVLANDIPFERILLIDNGSLLKHHQFLQTQCPKTIPHIRFEQNTGFAGGFNRAILEARKRGAEEVFFLTNDTLLLPNGVASLFESPQRKTCDFLAPLIRPVFDENKIDSLGGGFSEDEGTLFHYQELCSVHLLKEKDYIPGTAFWLRLSAHEKVGGMDENYFCYWDDVDYCFRARKFGCSLGTEPRIELRHHIRRTNGSKPLYTLYYYYRNRLRFIQQHFAESAPRLYEKIYQELLLLKKKYQQQPPRRLLVENILKECYGSHSE